MGRSRGRPKTRRLSVNPGQKQEPAPTLSKEKKSQTAISPKLLRRWQNTWSILGPIVTLISLFFLLSPSVTIEPSVNLDPSQTLATQFLITNRGHVPIYNVQFSCGYGFPLSIGNLEGNGWMIRPVPELPAGVAVTRACSIASKDVETSDINISVTYSWPVIGWIKKSTETRHFSIRRGSPGFFLVPDLPN